MKRNCIPKFCDTYWLSKMFKNVCINPILKKHANYNIMSRSSHWNVFCKKGVPEISSRILQKYLSLSSYLVNELLVYLLLKFCLIFDSAKEASSDVTTFLNMRFITTQKLAFWENITYYILQVRKVSLKTCVENGTQ